jgi:hypothetical protein
MGFVFRKILFFCKVKLLVRKEENFLSFAIQGVPKNYGKADALSIASRVYPLSPDRVVFRLGLKSLIESTFNAFLQATKRFFAYALLHSKANAHATRPNFERCKFSLPKFFGTPCNKLQNYQNSNTVDPRYNAIEGTEEFSRYIESRLY